MATNQSVNLEQILPEYKDTQEDLIRDRIVILGRTQAGKTIFLSALYEMLWYGRDGLSMKALEGQRHREFMKTAATLRKGKWPESTTSSRKSFLELNYNGHVNLMVAMDYSGELLDKAFVSEEEANDNAKELCEHLDNAAAVIILIDPSQVTGPDATEDSIIENDFGIVQAISRLRSLPDGNKIPVVLALTKADNTLPVLRENGGTSAFVKKFFPKLISTVENLKVCKVSAVQCTGVDGELKPKPDFVPTNLDMPLRYCLDMIYKTEEARAVHKIRQKAIKKNIAQIKKQQKRDKIMTTIFFIVVFTAIGIMLYYILTTFWPNLLDRLI